MAAGAAVVAVLKFPLVHYLFPCFPFGMDEPFDPDEEERFGYAWDIGMALRKLPLYLGRRKLSLDDKITLGRQIVHHLRRAGVLFGRKSPRHGHGQPVDRNE